MPKTGLIPHDSALYLTTPRKRALYLEAMIEESDNDPTAILLALNTIARSEGMTSVSRKSGLSRENLYRSLSGDKKPEFGTILKVMAALGLRFHVVAKTAAAKPGKGARGTTQSTKDTKGTQGTNGARTTAKARTAIPVPRTPKPGVKQAA